MINHPEFDFERFDSQMGWRLGLQAATGLLLSAFFLGTFYRSASLYHPQRRAIIHLKTQRKKVIRQPATRLVSFHSFCRLFQVKVKGKPSNDRPPYFDFSVLRLKSLRMILLSSGIGSVGAYTPLFYLVRAPIDLSTIFVVVRRHSFHPPTHRRLATRKFRNKSKRHTLRDKAQAKSDGLRS